MTALSDLAVGESADVESVGGGGAIAIRLLEMGFVPGTRVRVIKRAPMGDPIEFRVRGYHISLRQAEARKIAVTR